MMRGGVWAAGACAAAVEAAGWAAMGVAVETGDTEADGELKPMDLPAHGEATVADMAAAGVAPAGVLLLTKKRTFVHKKINNKQLFKACSLLKKQNKKKSPKKFPHSPQYFKMMVLLLYIQNQDKQKMTKKKSNQIPRKKKFRILLLPKTTPKIPQKQKIKICHTPQFFLQVMNKILERKKNNQKKTKQAREKEIMFLFLTPRFRKKDYN